MVSLIKNLIFGKRELTTEELINQFEKSSKNIEDFKKTILNIKQNELNNILLKQIGYLNIKNINELNDLINILQEKNIIQEINLSSNQNKKQIYYLFQQLKFLNEIYNNYIKDNEIFSYCFKDKYLFFNYLIEKLDTNNNLNKIIYNTYFQKEIYLKLLEYNLFNNIEKNLIFLIPNQNNIDYINNFQSIPKYCELKNYFNKINDKDLIQENWLNLYIYFENKEDLFNKLQHLQIENYDKINSLLNLYNINKKINNNLTIYNFFKNKNIQNNFYSLYNFDSYSNFTNIIKDIIKFSKKKEIINIEFLPIKILEILLIKKSKYEFISFTIDKIFDSNLYDRISFVNFIIKILFEFYCENYSSSIQLSKIIGHLSKIFPDIINLSDKINNSLKFIQILENNQITLTLNELIISENNNDNSVIMQCLINYIYNICENSINDKEYNFIDKLKMNDVIESYYWMINYTSDNEGDLIIGEQPHIIDPLNYKEEDLFKHHPFLEDSMVGRGLIFDDINFKDKYFREFHESYFNYGINYIKGVVELEKELDKYFNESIQDGICYKVTIKYSYYPFKIYYCDKDKYKDNIKNFPKLTFFQYDFNYTFELDYTDLFKEKGDKIILMIFFDEAPFDWYLGKPFLKKYSFLMNQDSKIVGFYKRKDYKNSDNSNDDNNVILKIILIVIGVIILLILGIFIGKYFFKNNKKHKNILDEDYDYTTKIDEIN